MRADRAVPVIRSTAPAPNTFGTAQEIPVGHAVVPPRDYGQGVQIPDSRNYDTDESGTIYDIAYRGIAGRELVFEQRGYSIDDLAHASSGQLMRFPVAQKTIRIGDIEIEVLKGTAGSLRFRAILARKDGEDGPFACADPACTPR